MLPTSALVYCADGNARDACVLHSGIVGLDDVGGLCETMLKTSCRIRQRNMTCLFRDRIDGGLDVTRWYLRANFRTCFATSQDMRSLQMV